MLLGEAETAAVVTQRKKRPGEGRSFLMPFAAIAQPEDDIRPLEAACGGGTASVRYRTFNPSATWLIDAT
jgi:hypothetical protein